MGQGAAGARLGLGRLGLGRLRLGLGLERLVFGALGLGPLGRPMGLEWLGRGRDRRRLNARIGLGSSAVGQDGGHARDGPRPDWPFGLRSRATGGCVLACIWLRLHLHAEPTQCCSLYRQPASATETQRPGFRAFRLRCRSKAAPSPRGSAAPSARTRQPASRPSASRVSGLPSPSPSPASLPRAPLHSAATRWLAHRHASGRRAWSQAGTAPQPRARTCHVTVPGKSG